MNSRHAHYIKTLRLSKEPEDIKKAIDLLRKDHVVALPTETVYGLAANGLEPQALLRIFSAKGRPLNNPLILHTDHLKKADSLFDLAKQLHKNRLNKLAQAFWPGPLTIVAKKAHHVPLEATGNLPTVGVRVPRHPVTLAIMSELNFPLAMPSANISTRPSPTTAEHVLKTLDGKISAVVDGGISAVGIESTIVQIDTEQVEILRLGMINETMLADCLDEPVHTTSLTVHDAPRAPGSTYLHYSPAVASVELVSLPHAKSMWLSETMMLARTGDIKNLEQEIGPRPGAARTIMLSDTPATYAQELYDALYSCEATPHLKLLIIVPPQKPEWQAIHDRLSRSEKNQR
jgi:L-threonylcarbamoyladenylate synthase